jgi:hypothetical protein
MSFSEMLRRVVLVRTDVSEEVSASIIRVTRLSELRTTLAVNSHRSTLGINAILLLVIVNVPSSPILVTPIMVRTYFSKTSVLNNSHAF